MLFEKIDSEKYKFAFDKKFSNFCEKAPILISFVKTSEGVTVIHENSGTPYDYLWDFTIPVKKFIYDIKQELVENHYPRLIQTITKERPATPEEQAEFLENGGDPKEVPSAFTESKEILWLIDKVIVIKDIFIVRNEETQEMFRYKMNRSSIFFLKNYRSGKFTLESAGAYFFKYSDNLGQLQPVENHG
jgi:hypothetical protein